MVGALARILQTPEVKLHNLQCYFYGFAIKMGIKVFSDYELLEIKDLGSRGY